jgi:hypothetical protein
LDSLAGWKAPMGTAFNPEGHGLQEQVLGGMARLHMDVDVTTIAISAGCVLHDGRNHHTFVTLLVLISCDLIFLHF